MSPPTSTPLLAPCPVSVVPLPFFDNKVQTEKYHLILGDCLNHLKKKQSESIDLVLTDAPYGIANEVVITRGRNGMKFR